MTRVFEGFLGSEMSSFSPKASLDMLRLDPHSLAGLDYCEFYLGLFYSKEEIFKMGQVDMVKRIWERFDSSLTVVENLLLKMGFLQTNHKSEVEYLQKEIGKREKKPNLKDLKDKILNTLKRDIQQIKGEYKIDSFWTKRVEMENIVDSENSRLKTLLEISLKMIEDTDLVSEIFENSSKTKLLGVDMNKFLKVALVFE